MSEKPLSKAEARYQRFVTELPDSVQDWLQNKRQEPRLEDQSRYASLLDDLPDSVKEYLASKRQPEHNVEAEGWLAELDGGPQWCICEQEEGRFPKIRIFRDLDVMVRYLARHEGEEISMWGFLGTPLPYTAPDPVTGARVLVLPGGQGVRISVDRELEFTDAPREGTKFQLDGWLGPVSMSEGRSAEFYAGNEEIVRARQAEADETDAKKPKRAKPRPEEDEGESDGETAPQ